MRVSLLKYTYKTHSIIYSKGTAQRGKRLTSKQQAPKQHFTTVKKWELKLSQVSLSIFNILCWNVKQMSVKGSCGCECALGGAPSLHQDKTTWWYFSAKSYTKPVMTTLCMQAEWWSVRVSDRISSYQHWYMLFFNQLVLLYFSDKGNMYKRLLVVV